jgi:hypothetical protein
VIAYQNNVFDSNAYHVADTSTDHWMWAGYQNWDGMHLMGQELHGTLDSNLPPAQ